jgi:hypothetical protein
MDDTAIVITVIGWVITNVIAYRLGLRAWFEKRRVERVERFEQLIDNYRAVFPNPTNDRYESFALHFFARCKDAADRNAYLRERNVPETREFYKWLDTKQNTIEFSALSEMR